MADVVRFQGGFRMTEAGHVVLGLVRVTSILCVVDGGAAPNVGVFTFKNGAGVTFADPRVGGTDANGGVQSVVVPVDTDIDGIEIDALPTNAEVTVFHK